MQSVPSRGGQGLTWESLLVSIPLCFLRKLVHVMHTNNPTASRFLFNMQPHVIGSLESLSELWLDTNIISVLPEVSGGVWLYGV